MQLDICMNNDLYITFKLYCNYILENTINGNFLFPQPPPPIWDSQRSREEVNMKTPLSGFLKAW